MADGAGEPQSARDSESEDSEHDAKRNQVHQAAVRRRVLGRISAAWDHARESLWFVPALCVFGAVALSTGLLALDRAILSGNHRIFWLFDGNAQGARTVLSVIASSLVTVIAVAFSVTIVALQQASTQFTPRVLRMFTSDRGNQVVLGIYVATFSYAILVLRRVRESAEGRPAFVPSLSISMGMLLSLASLFALIYFIHHLSESLQVGYLLSSVTGELERELERLFPERLGRGEPAPKSFEEYARENADACSGHELTMCSNEAGYLRALDLKELTRVARKHFRFLRVEVRIGEYLHRGQTVARGYSEVRRDGEVGETVVATFQIDRYRSPRQDPLFGIRQLVDVAMKSLSPGINDPTTAEQALDHLGRAITLLSGRAMPSALRVLDGTKVLVREPTYADYIDAAFAQIRAAACQDLHVTLHLVGTIQRVIEHTESDARKAPLYRELEQALATFDQTHLSSNERARLARELATVRAG